MVMIPKKNVICVCEHTVYMSKRGFEVKQKQKPHTHQTSTAKTTKQHRL